MRSTVSVVESAWAAAGAAIESPWAAPTARWPHAISMRTPNKNDTPVTSRMVSPESGLYLKPGHSDPQKKSKLGWQNYSSSGCSRYGETGVVERGSANRVGIFREPPPAQTLARVSIDGNWGSTIERLSRLNRGSGVRGVASVPGHGNFNPKRKARWRLYVRVPASGYLCVSCPSSLCSFPSGGSKSCSIVRGWAACRVQRDGAKCGHPAQRQFA